MRNSDLRESQHSNSQQHSQGQGSQRHGSQVNSQSLPLQGSGSKTRGSSWVRLGIRRQANTARILMYQHQDPVEGTSLSGLADGLLEAIMESRPPDVRFLSCGVAQNEYNHEDANKNQGLPRPIIFICHSIGGLVAKMALCKASRNKGFERVINDCYGVAFFGTTPITSQISPA